MFDVHIGNIDLLSFPFRVFAQKRIFPRSNYLIVTQEIWLIKVIWLGYRLSELLSFVFSFNYKFLLFRNHFHWFLSFQAAELFPHRRFTSLRGLSGLIFLCNGDSREADSQWSWITEFANWFLAVCHFICPFVWSFFLASVTFPRLSPLSFADKLYCSLISHTSIVILRPFLSPQRLSFWSFSLRFLAAMRVQRANPVGFDFTCTSSGH